MRGIAFIISKAEVGGAQKWVKEQLEMLSGLGVGPIFLISDDQDGWLSREVDNLVEDALFDVRFANGFSVSNFFKFLKFIYKNEPEVIVASSAYAGVYARLLKFFLNTKVVYVSHGWSSIYRGRLMKAIFVFIERVLSGMTDRILCVSEQDLIAAKNVIGISDDRLVLIENKLFAVKNKKIIVDGLENVPRILCVSRLDRPKRLDLCINAVRGKNCTLHIIGDGPQMNELRSIAKNQSNVIFEGIEYGFSRYSEYDVFLLASDSEGLPMSALEAMSAGLPLILSRVGGCCSLIDGNGILFENTVDELASAIDVVIANSVEMSHLSLRLFQKRFDLSVHSSDYTELYDLRSN